MKDENDKYVYGSWPLYVEGILSPEEQSLVEKNHQNHFLWESRKWRLLDTIKRIDVDILSLVECDHYADHFQQGLSQMGYSSCWRQRPRKSSVDGCCVAWRPGIFEYIAEHSIDFVDRYCEKRKQQVIDRMALMVLLRVCLTGDIICFVSTHLATNPEQEELDHLRARQVAQMMRSIAGFVRRHGADDAPIVLAGDFNAAHFGRLKCIANAITLLSGDKTSHPFIFDCADVPTGATSVTTARNVRIDAIFYQKSRLDLLDVGETPSLSLSNPIPNDNHPSDHVPISATFSLRSPLQMGYLGAQEWYCRLLGRGSVLLNCSQLLEAFKIIDHDSTGCVTASKLKRSLQFVMDSNALDPEDFARVALLLTEEGISFKVFSSMYADCVCRAGLPYQMDLEAAFKICNGSRSNELCHQKVLDAFAERVPAEVPQEEVEALFARVNKSATSLHGFLEHLSACWSDHFRNSFGCRNCSAPGTTLSRHCRI
jgi:endonuclease/exonuclease/phosphatase family metal-dependent hydrolase